jgi:hypothetical protein
MMFPYSGIPKKKWVEKTKELVAAHPLKGEEIVEVVLHCWEAIFKSKIGPHGFRIGTDLFPKPQIMGFFLHELIPLEFTVCYPGKWRGEQTARDKDLVYLPDPQFSVEIKTSSHKTQIFGNRSYAQKPSSAKKNKSGYYLAINFEKFGKNKPLRPRITRIRFGWLDHTDWIGQVSATGQQAHLGPDTEAKKLITLH